MSDTPYGNAILRVEVDDEVYMVIDTPLGNMYAKEVTNYRAGGLVEYKEMSATDFKLAVMSIIEGLM